MTVVSKTDKLLNALKGKKVVSTRALRARTGLQNLSSTVHRLREQGFPIITSTNVNSRGEIVNFYRMASY